MLRFTVLALSLTEITCAALGVTVFVTRITNVALGSPSVLLYV